MQIAKCVDNLPEPTQSQQWCWVLHIFNQTLKIVTRQIDHRKIRQLAATGDVHVKDANYVWMVKLAQHLEFFDSQIHGCVVGL